MALVQVQSPGADGGPTGVHAAAAEAAGTTPRVQVVVGSFAAILVAWLISVLINLTFKPSAFAIPAGIGLFAMLYAVTQGLERLLEPVSSFFFTTKQHAENRNAALAAAINLQSATDEQLPSMVSTLAKAQRADAVPDAGAARGRARRMWYGVLRRARHNVATEGVNTARAHMAEMLAAIPRADGQDRDQIVEVTRRTALNLAAAAQAELDQRRADKSVAYWALASALGLLLSGTLGLYLLHIIGLRDDGLTSDGGWASGILTASGFRHMIDLLVTGLAVGGGTKPLHDLISNLQAAKDDKKDPDQTR